MEPQEESIKMQTLKINNQVVDIIEHDSEASLLEKNAQTKETSSLHIKKVIHFIVIKRY